MEQLNFFPQQKNPPTVCAFTGHRALGEDFSVARLEEEIFKAVENGISTFLCGMAVGFDLLAAEIVLTLKENNPLIKLIACIPCKEQDKYYSKEDKTRYYFSTLLADEKILLSERYYRGCMQARDDYMAKNADFMIAYCKKQEGGTAYTVRQFQKHHPDGKIVFL